MRLTLADADPSGEPTARFAFFIEDDEALAERFGATAFELDEGRALPVTAFDVRSLVTVFGYMIGNTDWSEVTGHNVAITHLVLEDFRAAEPAILRLFEADERLDADSRTRTVRYLEALLDDNETDQRAERQFLRYCRRP